MDLVIDITASPENTGRKRSGSNSNNSNVKVQKQNDMYHTFGELPKIKQVGGKLVISKLAQPDPMKTSNTDEVLYKHLYVNPLDHKLGNEERICIICFGKTGDIKKSLKKDTLIKSKDAQTYNLSFTNFKKHIVDVHPEQLVISHQNSNQITEIVANVKAPSSAITVNNTLNNLGFTIIDKNTHLRRKEIKKQIENAFVKLVSHGNKPISIIENPIDRDFVKSIAAIFEKDEDIIDNLPFAGRIHKAS